MLFEKLFGQRPDLRGGLSYALLHYCQMRYVLETHRIWDPALARREMARGLSAAVRGAGMTKVAMLIAAFLVVGGDATSSSLDVNICYIPIGSQTIVAVTRENIEQNCVRTKRVSSASGRMRAISAEIERAGQGEFDDQIVRVSVAYRDGRRVYVDNEGGVISEKATRRLDGAALDRVKQFVEGIVGSTP